MKHEVEEQNCTKGWHYVLTCASGEASSNPVVMGSGLGSLGSNTGILKHTGYSQVCTRLNNNNN